MTINLTEGNFDSVVLDSEVPVLVKFGATWCGPCKALTPILDQISVDHVDELLVVDVDVDEFPDLAESYNVSSVPTMFIFDGGLDVDRINGVKPRAQLEAIISKYI